MLTQGKGIVTFGGKTVKHKLLQFPNGYQTTSDRIQRVRVFPERSLSLTKIFVEVVERSGVVYRGNLDLHRIEVAQHQPVEK